MIDLPDEYLDETVYSLAARFSARMRYPSNIAVIERLFGIRIIGNLNGLPCRLRYLVSSLSSNNSLTVTQLIKKHSLLPYFAPFISEHELSELQKFMEGTELPNQKLVRPSIRPVRFLPKWLRYCPICVDMDRKKYGECYWHRLHQARGVLVCPQHHVYLKDSTVVHSSRVFNTQELFPAENVVTQIRPEPINVSSQHDRILLKIASNVEWLLDKGSLTSHVDRLYSNYQQEILRRRLNGNSSRYSMNTLAQEFFGAYPMETLELLNFLPRAHTKRTWVHLLLGHNQLSDPIKHLLLIDFFGYSIHEFMQIDSRHDPFGNAPWLCLNPYCESYRERVVTSCNTSYRKTDDSVNYFL